MYHRLSFLLLVLLCVTPLAARSLTVGNEGFRSRIEFRGHRFVGMTWVELPSGRVLTSGAGDPLFELCIDGSPVSASDPVWDYAGQTRLALANGGTRVSFAFRGRGALKGLRLVWDRESFPDAAFVRERLRLASGGGRTFRLTNREGRNHLVFPCYAFAEKGPVRAKELRIGTFRAKRAFPDHHMFHPDSVLFEPDAAVREVKGPFLILSGPQFKVLTSYEHASQDNSFAKPDSRKKSPDRQDAGNDGSQGVEGGSWTLRDDDLWFISSFTSQRDGCLRVGNRIRHGAYLDGEAIPSDGWYETVWSTISVLPPDGAENEAIADYLLTKITANPASREADFYYNTWGMQRSSPDLYSVMNQERLREEIRYAAECGVSTVVLDDGWHETFGHWVCNPERIPGGLRSLTAYMDSLGIRPGIWLSLPGAGPATERYLAHPEWIIRDAKGDPVLAQWKNPVYDLVGPYYDCLLSDLKALCDEGFRFFKWDAMNTLSSTLPGLYHGDGRDPARDRADRYNYLLPFYVTRLMRELREYCPGVVVELDLTEPERCLVGLQVLQEGKFYFINNGSSKYADYSSYRSRSVRSVINRYADFMPQELFTYAVYPQDLAGAQLYNLTTALTAGHGIWGDLSLMTPQQRSVVKDLFGKAMRVMPHLKGFLVERTGAIDACPEVYIQRNPSEAYALMTAFSAQPLSLDWIIRVDPAHVLAVLNHPYSLIAEGVSVPLRFVREEDCASAFVLGTGPDPASPRILSSTGRLDDVTAEAGSLHVTAVTETDIVVGMPDGRREARHIPAGGSLWIR